MRSSKTLYAVLVVARLLLSISPAYIHPDEFFQAPEVVAGDVLGLDILRTWEFASELPVRSIVPIYLYAGTPMLLLKSLQHVLLKLGVHLPLTTTLVFCTTRLFMALLTFLIDYSLYSAIRRLNATTHLRSTMLLLASSYCLAVFHSHTFANAFASILLAICFNILSILEQQLCASKAAKTPPTSRSSSSSSSSSQVGSQVLAYLLFGICLCLGTFTHVSFFIYALPLGLACAALLLRSASRGTIPLSLFFSRLAFIAAGGLGTAAVLTIIDSVYFGKLKLSLSLRSFSCSGSLTFTILNNYSYNTNTDNLATHGIHPWYQHSLASMPSLFGPLYALAIFKVWSLMKSPSARQHTSYTSMAAAASVVLGLVVLSTVPHQEARFLLPALPGIVICTSSWHRLAPSYFWYAWAVFNTALTIGYGVVHQSGVVPVLGYLSKTSALRSVECKTENASGDAVCGVALGALDHGTGTRPRLTTHVYTFATYMAPRHLLVQPKTGTSMESRVQLTDLISKTDIEIRDVIRHSVMINKTAALHLDESVERMYRQTSPGHYERALFVMPASVDMQRVVPPDTKEYGLLPIYSFAPHVNFDHIPDILQHPAAKARLNVYLVTTG